MNNPNLKEFLSNTFIPFSDGPIPFNQDQLAERFNMISHYYFKHTGIVGPKNYTVSADMGYGINADDGIVEIKSVSSFLAAGAIEISLSFNPELLGTFIRITDCQKPENILTFYEKNGFDTRLLFGTASIGYVYYTDFITKEPRRFNKIIRCCNIDSFVIFGLREIIIPPESESEYKGCLEGFPEEVVEMMLYYQEKQTGKRDISVFEKRLYSGTWNRGFDWDKTCEGNKFWRKVIRHKEFGVFFEKYPKTKTKTITHGKEGKILKVQRTKATVCGGARREGLAISGKRNGTAIAVRYLSNRAISGS